MKNSNIKNIRLTKYELLNIVKIFKEFFSQNDSLWLFGSRTNPKALGGDIDLYIESEIQDTKILYELRKKFLMKLENQIGEQKIDVVLGFLDMDLPIYKIAKKEGVKLV